MVRACVALACGLNAAPRVGGDGSAWVDGVGDVVTGEAWVAMPMSGRALSRIMRARAGQSPK